MSTWLAPAAGDYVVEIVGNGIGGGTHGGGYSGAGGGAYIRKKFTATNGQSYTLSAPSNNDVNPVKLTVTAGGATVGEAKSGGTLAGGLASASTGDVKRNGGNGYAEWGTFSDDGGGGGGGATRMAAGANAFQGTGGATSATVIGGAGSPRFTPTTPAIDGIGAGSGSGGRGNSGTGPVGVGKAGYIVIWSIANWVGDPTVDGTQPKGGAAPEASAGTYEPAPPVSYKSRKAAQILG